MNYGYIYKTTNLLNNQIYIGQKKDIFSSDYFGSGNLIRKDVKDFGKNNFKVEFICSALNKQELNKAEIEWIKKLNCVFPNGYNLSLGGDGASWGHVVTEETRRKISQNQDSLGMTGKQHSQETREKMRLKKLGIKHSQEHNDSIRKSHLGKKHKKLWSLESREKARRSKLGFIPWNKGKVDVYSDETKEKMRIARLNYVNNFR